MKDSFFWQIIEFLPKVTTDPKRLAYLRLPFRDLYRAIRNKYTKLEKRPKKLFVVSLLSKEEEEKLKNNQDNFIIFTSFVKGFTNEKEANKARKAKAGSIMFEIILNTKDRDEELDFGFCQIGEEGENIIFNIYNFFKIDACEIEGRRAVLTYAALAEASAKRKDKKKRIRPTVF